MMGTIEHAMIEAFFIAGLLCAVGAAYLTIKGAE